MQTWIDSAYVSIHDLPVPDRLHPWAAYWVWCELGTASLTIPGIEASPMLRESGQDLPLDWSLEVSARSGSYVDRAIASNWLSWREGHNTCLQQLQSISWFVWFVSR